MYRQRYRGFESLLLRIGKGRSARAGRPFVVGRGATYDEAHLRRVPALRFERFAPEVRAVVWAARESTDELAAALPEHWRRGLPRHPSRARETLSARRALLALLPEAAPATLTRDRYGRPRLPDLPGVFFSLSHSHGHAAALVARSPCGVDLQRRVEKITRLRSKFERPDERASVARAADEAGALHVLWGAKESLFKLWSRREVDWHEHLVVRAFDYVPGGGSFLAEVRKTDPPIPARAWWRWLDEFCLVGAVDVGGSALALPDWP